MKKKLCLLLALICCAAVFAVAFAACNDEGEGKVDLDEKFLSRCGSADMTMSSSLSVHRHMPSGRSVPWRIVLMCPWSLSDLRMKPI